MHKSNLMLHCGAAKIERDALELVSTPDPTASWTPVAHFDFLTGVEGARLPQALRRL